MKKKGAIAIPLQKRPVWVSIMESHPFKDRAVLMDYNIHPGSLGLLPIINPKRFAGIERYIGQIMGESNKPKAFVYRYPAYIVSFFKAWKENAKIAFTRRGEGGVSPDPRLGIKVELVEEKEGYREIVIDKADDIDMTNYFPVGSWVTLPTNLPEMPNKQVISIQLIRALTAVPQFLKRLVPENHILKMSWVFRVKGKDLELVERPKEIIESSKTVIRAIDGFNTAGKGIMEKEVPFPTTEEEARELVDIEAPSGSYITVAPLIQFPEERTILYKGKPFAYHVRPLFDPETYDYIGIALKLTEYNPEGINNSSAGVHAWNIIDGKVYAPSLEGGPYTYVDVRQGFPQRYRYKIGEVEVEIGDHLPQMEEEALTMLAQMAESYQQLVEYFEKATLREIYEEWRKEIPPNAKTMLAQVGLTRKSLPRLDEL